MSSQVRGRHRAATFEPVMATKWRRRLSSADTATTNLSLKDGGPDVAVHYHEARAVSRPPRVIP